MGVNVGQPKAVKDPVTHRIEFVGPVVNACARITALAHGGQVSVDFPLLSYILYYHVPEPNLLCAVKLFLTAVYSAEKVLLSPSVHEKLKDSEMPDLRMVYQGRFEIPDSPEGRSQASIATMLMN